MLHLETIDPQGTSPCCDMSFTELKRQEYICHSCVVQLEAEAEDCALEGALEDYRNRRSQ